VDLFEEDKDKIYLPGEFVCSSVKAVSEYIE